MRNHFYVKCTVVMVGILNLDKSLQVQFPYATEEEMALLETTVNSSFKDVQSDETLDKVRLGYCSQGDGKVKIQQKTRSRSGVRRGNGAFFPSMFHKCVGKTDNGKCIEMKALSKKEQLYKNIIL